MELICNQHGAIRWSVGNRFLYGECKRSFDETAIRFNEMHTDYPIMHMHGDWLRSINRLSLRDKKSSRRPEVDEDKKIDVVPHNIADPQQYLAATSKVCFLGIFIRSSHK